MIGHLNKMFLVSWLWIPNTQWVRGNFWSYANFSLVSCSDPTHEMRGSCDVWPITWASLTSITYFFSANNIGENTICSATLEILGFSTMTHHFLASIWAISSQLWIQQLSHEFLKQLKEPAKCHQILSCGWGLYTRLTLLSLPTLKSGSGPLVSSLGCQE